jgi:hypothetical protein
MGSFFPAQLGRFLLTLLTLGIHRFWWKTAVRRRLWAETTVDGDPLEYMGRGIEMFVGALIVFAAVLIPLSALSFVAQLLQGSGQLLWAGWSRASIHPSRCPSPSPTGALPTPLPARAGRLSSPAA